MKLVAVKDLNFGVEHAKARTNQIFLLRMNLNRNSFRLNAGHRVRRPPVEGQRVCCCTKYWA